MRNLITILLLTSSLFAYSQEKINARKDYKENTVCVSWDVYKGKKNHGQKYCTTWATVRTYNDGRADTTSYYGGGKLLSGDEVYTYEKLSERGKYIVDSLKEDGITQFQNAYLTYEPICMKQGKKVERLWHIEGDDVVIYDYLFFNNNKGRGIELIRQFTQK